jgi:hypothetical protein
MATRRRRRSPAKGRPSPSPSVRPRRVCAALVNRDGTTGHGHLRRRLLPFNNGGYSSPPSEGSQYSGVRTEPVRDRSRATQRGVSAPRFPDRLHSCVLGRAPRAPACPLPAGICQDRTSPSTTRPRTDASFPPPSSWVGNAAPPFLPTTTQAWVSKSFYNPAMVTVRDFSPTRGRCGRRLPRQTAPILRSKVFGRGRPLCRARSRARRHLYFAYVDMPTYDAAPFRLGAAVHGHGLGKPQFRRTNGRRRARSPGERVTRRSPAISSTVQRKLGRASQAVGHVFTVAIPRWRSSTCCSAREGRASFAIRGAIHARFADHLGAVVAPDHGDQKKQLDVNPPRSGTSRAGGHLAQSPVQPDCAPPTQSVWANTAGGRRLYGASITRGPNRYRGSADIYWPFYGNPYGGCS